MKANAIIRIVIYSLLIAILLGILVGVLLINPRSRLRYSSPTEAVVSDSSEFTASVPMETRPDQRYASYPVDRITDLEIDWVAGDIQLRAVEGIHDIRVCETGSFDSSYKMVCRIAEHTLIIKYCQKNTFSFSDVFSTHLPEKNLTVEVPADWFCQELEIDAASSHLEVEGLTAREVDFNGASGMCNFHNCQIQDLDLDTASGDVTFDGTLTTLDFDAASASFTGQFRNTPNNIDMDSMAGDLVLYFPEDCGYTISLNGMSTSFHSAFQNDSIHNGTLIYGSGACRINVDGMSCNVTIRKLDTAK